MASTARSKPHDRTAGSFVHQAAFYPWQLDQCKTPMTLMPERGHQTGQDTPIGVCPCLSGFVRDVRRCPVLSGLLSGCLAIKN